MEILKIIGKVVSPSYNAKLKNEEQAKQKAIAEQRALQEQDEQYRREEQEKKLAKEREEWEKRVEAEEKAEKEEFAKQCRQIRDEGAKYVRADELQAWEDRCEEIINMTDHPKKFMESYQHIATALKLQAEGASVKDVSKELSNANDCILDWSLYPKGPVDFYGDYKDYDTEKYFLKFAQNGLDVYTEKTIKYLQKRREEIIAKEDDSQKLIERLKVVDNCIDELEEYAKTMLERDEKKYNKTISKQQVHENTAQQERTLN